MMEGLFFQHLPPTLPSPRLRLRRLRVCGATSRAELMATIDDEGASTRSGGSLETIIHHEGSALARSASWSYLASASAHSQDQGPDGTTEEVVCEEEGIQATLEELNNQPHWILLKKINMMKF